MELLAPQMKKQFAGRDHRAYGFEKCLDMLLAMPDLIRVTDPPPNNRTLFLR
jgi:hypothetical protein